MVTLLKKYKHLVYAGTFDRLHIGHKKLLDRAFELGEKVSIGITGKNLYGLKPLANLILTWQVRMRAVEQYLRERNWLERAEFFELDDIYGPAIVDKTMDSILVTELTKENAEKINTIRIKKRLQQLEIIIEPFVRGDDGEIVTSERIRLGEIDREGKSYGRIMNSYSEAGKKKLILPENMRVQLRRPLGKVIGGSVNRLSSTANKLLQYVNLLKQTPTMLISVGDIVTMSLIDSGFIPDVKIIDFKSRRKEIKVKIKSNHNTLIKFINEPGTINLNTAKEIKNTIVKFIKTGEKQLIVVEGEEDLLALPAILSAPLGAIVIYGQFDLGVVIVEVAEEKKKEVKKILRKFN